MHAHLLYISVGVTKVMTIDASDNMTGTSDTCGRMHFDLCVHRSKFMGYTRKHGPCKMYCGSASGMYCGSVHRVLVECTVDQFTGC